MYRQSEKIVKQQYFLHMRSQYGESSRISRVDTHFPKKLPFDLYLTFILIHFNVYRRSQ